MKASELIKKLKDCVGTEKKDLLKGMNNLLTSVAQTDCFQAILSPEKVEKLSLEVKNILSIDGKSLNDSASKEDIIKLRDKLFKKVYQS